MHRFWFFSINVCVLIVAAMAVQASDLCGGRNRSCTKQLWANGSEPLESCLLTYYKLNSAECASISYQYKMNADAAGGGVRLKAFVTEMYRQTLFDVVFTNIIWKKLFMRFSKIGSENEKNMCSKFEIKENVTVPKSSVLTYDCPWSHGDYEGEDFSLEYEFDTPNLAYRKLIFKVPLFNHFNGLTRVENLQVFTYIDVTNSEYLQLYIQTADSKYNITGYLVEVIRERSNMSSRLTVQILKASESVDGQITFLYPTWNEFGYFYFNVSVISEKCGENQCLKSSTPKYLVGRKKSSLVIGIVGASVILFALFYAMFFWNRKKHSKEGIQPRILLVYNNTVNSHCTVVHNLARMLQELLHIEVLLDVVNIPHTSHKDPQVWCSHAFAYATHIIYIASPEVGESQVQPNSAYKVHGCGLRYIKEELLLAHSTKQMFVVTFSYSANSVPPELVNLRKFNLMKDIDNFINVLIMPPYQSFTFLQIYRPNRFRGAPQYIDLIASIHATEKEMEMLLDYPISPPINASNITIRVNSEDNLAMADDDTSGDEEAFLKAGNDDFNFRVSELDLTGNKASSQRQEDNSTALHDCRINLQDLDL